MLLLESALFGLFVIAIMIDQMAAIMFDETAVEAVQQRGGGRYGQTYRPASRSIRGKLKLLADVCGRENPALWLLPCSNSGGDGGEQRTSSGGSGPYSYEEPLLHDV